MSGVGLILLRPMWLLALVPLALTGWWLLRRSGRLGDWHKVSDPALMAAMAALGRVDREAQTGPVAMVLATSALIILGLSGPAVERRDTVSFRNLDGVLFVMDASLSVTEDPRWGQMQAMGRFGIASLGTRPGGLIVFAGDSYVASDMTLDHLQLGQSLSLIDAKTVPDPGSRPERALEQAADMLTAAEIIAGDVILMTDGAGLDAGSLQAAASVAATGARLSLVSLNAPSPEFQTHAQAGGGGVFTLDQATDFAEWIGGSDRTRLQAQDFPLLYWRDMGRYLMLLALVPVALLFRRQQI